MNRNAAGRELLFAVVGLIMALVNVGCSATSDPRNLDELFNQGWMLKSIVIEDGIKKMLEKNCGVNPTKECMKVVGFQECSRTQGGLECSYSEKITVKHDRRAKVRRQKEALNIDVEIKLYAGMHIKDAVILINRSGTNFIFR